MSVSMPRRGIQEDENSPGRYRDTHACRGYFQSSSSFLPEKMNRHGITPPDYAQKDEPTPDYAQKDEPTPDYAQKDEPTPDYATRHRITRHDTGLRADLLNGGDVPRGHLPVEVNLRPLQLDHDQRLAGQPT